MKETIKNWKVSFLLAAALYLVLGLVLLLWPGTTAAVICYAFGGILVVYGAAAILSFFLSRAAAFVFDLFLGIAALALGIFLLVRPQVIISILPIVLGLFILVDGLLNLLRAFELRRLEYQRWGVSLALSLISLALGLVILFHPYLAAEALVMVIGGVFIYEGVSDIWTIFMVGRLTKELRKGGVGAYYAVLGPADNLRGAGNAAQFPPGVMVQAGGGLYEKALKLLGLSKAGQEGIQTAIPFQIVLRIGALCGVDYQSGVIPAPGQLHPNMYRFLHLRGPPGRSHRQYQTFHQIRPLKGQMLGNHSSLRHP